MQAWWAILLLAALGRALAAEPAAAGGEGPAPGVPGVLPPTNARLRQLGPQRFALGRVVFDKETRTITFPAMVNMGEGAIEYALVHTTGKVHESVLKTEVEPYHIQLARLLITPAAQAAVGDPKTPRDLTGASVSLSVAWSEAGAARRVRMEELIFNTLTDSPMKPGPWVYNGSRVVEGVFLAQRDGSIVTVIADPDAMVNNPRPGRNDDEIWRVNQAVVPRVGTPVEVTIQLDEQKK